MGTRPLVCYDRSASYARTLALMVKQANEPVHRHRLLTSGILLSVGGCLIVSTIAIGLQGASAGNSQPGGTKRPATSEGLIRAVTDPTTVYSVPAVPRPAYLATTIALFGTTITRITGDAGTPLNGITGTWGTDARHHYSKDQPWNADQTLIAMQNV